MINAQDKFCCYKKSAPITKIFEGMEGGLSSPPLTVLLHTTGPACVARRATALRDPGAGKPPLHTCSISVDVT